MCWRKLQSILTGKGGRYQHSFVDAVSRVWCHCVVADRWTQGGSPCWCWQDSLKQFRHTFCMCYQIDVRTHHIQQDVNCSACRGPRWSKYFVRVWHGHSYNSQCVKKTFKVLVLSCFANSLTLLETELSRLKRVSDRAGCNAEFLQNVKRRMMDQETELDGLFPCSIPCACAVVQVFVSFCVYGWLFVWSCL